MKKIISILVVTVMLAAAFAFSADAAESALVTVTISDGNGNIVVPFQKISVPDFDSDGKITLYDVFTAADPTFESEMTEWGLSVKKLCGVENGGSYGYYVNDQMAWGLSDEVKDGDYVAAYVFQDPKGLSDSYAFFDKKSGELSNTDDAVVELTLSHIAFDKDWNVFTEPVAGADIYLDGKKTALKTDADGKVTISFDDVDPYVYYGTEIGYVSASNSYALITAKADGMTLDCGAAFFNVMKTFPEPETSDTDDITDEVITIDTTDVIVAPAEDHAEDETTAPQVTTVGGDIAPQTGDAMIAVIALLALCAVVFTAVKRREER